MDLGNLKQVATQTFGRGLLLGKKHSPEILTAVGIVGVVVATALAIKATLKVEPIVDKMQSGLEAVEELKESNSLAHSSDTKEVAKYTNEDYLKDKTQVYVRGTIDLAKLYGPAATVMVLSIVSIVAAHGIMRKRNVALVAAYNVLEKAYSAYRERVVEEYGPERDEEFRSGTRKVEEIDFETGKKVVKTVKDPSTYSPYAKFFDEGNVHWSKVPQANLVFLRAQQQYANDLLVSRGHVFLNDIYDSIGIDRTSAGAVVGWVISKTGDNYIDFGMYDESSERARAFINGDERSIFLDFNVDGVIYDLI